MNNTIEEVIQNNDQCPKVSVIMPVYNAERYLRQSLDCLVNQTLEEIEFICVDDGSSDDSHNILTEYAEKDGRFRILHQENRGAGGARNLGLDKARGEYLLFLDSDDFFKPELAEHAWARAKEMNADICTYAAENYNDKTGVITQNPRTLMKDLYKDDVFNRHNDPDALFCFTLSNPWTKLFRRDFILEHGLKFQELPNANDVAFVFSALAIADRITMLDEVLVSYRTNNSESSQGSLKRAPLAFYESLAELKRRLIRFGVYEEMENAFIKISGGLVEYNLKSLRTSLPDFMKAYIFCKENCFSDFSLGEKEDGFYYFPNHARAIKVLRNETMLDFSLKIQYPAFEGEQQWEFLRNIRTCADKEPEVWMSPKEGLSSDAEKFFNDPYAYYCRTCRLYTTAPDETDPRTLVPLDGDPLLPVVFSFRNDLKSQNATIKTQKGEIDGLKNKLTAGQKALEQKTAEVNRLRSAAAEMEKKISDLVNESKIKDKQIRGLEKSEAVKTAKIKKLEERKLELRKEAQNNKKALDAVYSSRSYRIGNAVLRPFKRIVDLFAK